MNVGEMMRDALRQRYEMIERNPGDEKWAEWHIHPETHMALRVAQSQGELGRLSPTIERYPIEPDKGGRLFGYPVRVTTGAPIGKIQLVCETELDATIRHQREAGLGDTIHVIKPLPFIFPDPPTPPTLKALVKHWAKKLPRAGRKRA